MKRILIFAAIATVAIASLAHAETITLSATDRGWYNNYGSHDDTNLNFYTGTSYDFRGPDEYRSFFVFDLSSVNSEIIAASLLLNTGFTSFEYPQYPWNYQLTTVDVDVSTLTSYHADIYYYPETDGISIFDELGNGSAVASTLVGDTFPYDRASLTMNLQSSGVSYLNSSNGLIAFGGRITNLPEFADIEYPNRFGIFGGSQTYTPQLVLTVVPIPAAVWLFASGLGLLGWMKRKQVAK